MPIALQDGKVVTQDGKVSCQCCDGVCPSQLCGLFATNAIAQFLDFNKEPEFFNPYIAGGSWFVTANFNAQFTLLFDDAWTQNFNLTSSGSQTIEASVFDGSACCAVYQAAVPLTVTGTGTYAPAGQPALPVNPINAQSVIFYNLLVQINQRTQSTRLRVASINGIAAGVTLSGTNLLGQPISESIQLRYAKDVARNLFIQPPLLQNNTASPTQGSVFGTQTFTLFESLFEGITFKTSQFSDIAISNSFNWEFIPPPP